jgi:hypothetical protein
MSSLNCLAFKPYCFLFQAHFQKNMQSQTYKLQTYYIVSKCKKLAQFLLDKKYFIISKIDNLV